MPQFHTELQRLTQEKIETLESENRFLSNRLGLMKAEMAQVSTTTELQQTYQSKLQQLNEKLQKELNIKDQQIEKYQTYLSENIELPEQENLSKQLAPLLEKCLATYLNSDLFHAQIDQQIEAKLEKYSTTLEQLQAINWLELQSPEKSIEHELDTVLNEATNLMHDLRELARFFQNS